MELKYNINQFVKVKLTEYGKEILKKKHDENYGNLWEFDLESKTDENGYYREQLWVLMSTFGEYMGVYVDKEKMPFEVGIVLTGAEKMNN